MSADILARAAKLLRGQAIGAESGPWTTSPSKHVPGRYVHVDAPNGPQVCSAATTAWNNADYIAMMHPGVAFALADWLDLMAWQHVTFGQNMSDFLLDHSNRALAVARLILGEATS